MQQAVTETKVGHRRGPYHPPKTAVVKVRVVYDRYAVGEVQVISRYLYDDGRERVHQPRRAYLDPKPARSIPKVWEVVFDEVLRAKHDCDTNTHIEVELPNLGEWRESLITLLHIVAHELRVPLLGAHSLI